MRIILLLMIIICSLLIGIVCGFYWQKYKGSSVYNYETYVPKVGYNRGFGEVTRFFDVKNRDVGLFIHKDDNGVPYHYIAYNLSGDKNGPKINYYPNGSISSIEHYKNGKRHGQFIEFNVFGNIRKVSYWIMGDQDMTSFHSTDDEIPVSQYYSDKANELIKMLDNIR